MAYPICGVYIIYTPFINISLYGVVLPFILILSSILAVTKRPFIELRLGVLVFIFTTLGILFDNLYARFWVYSNIGVNGILALSASFLFGYFFISRINGDFISRINWMSFFILLPLLICDITLSFLAPIIVGKTVYLGGGGFTDGLMIVSYLIISISALWRFLAGIANEKNVDK